MENIWFIRMDKDWLEGVDINENAPFIHSVHGSCGQLEMAKKQKPFIFPSLSLDEKKLSTHIQSIKETLIKKGVIDDSLPGKQGCILAIRYWLSIMKEGDIVLVKNKLNTIYLCRVTGYVSEDFFDTHGCFQRPVKILQKVQKTSIHKDIWKRTQGRKTIERNKQKHITQLIKKHLNDYELA